MAAASEFPSGPGAGLGAHEPGDARVAKQCLSAPVEEKGARWRVRAGTSSTMPRAGSGRLRGSHRVPPGRKAEVHGRPSHAQTSAGKWPAPCPDLGDSRLPPERWPGHPLQGRGSRATRMGS